MNGSNEKRCQPQLPNEGAPRNPTQDSRSGDVRSPSSAQERILRISRENPSLVPQMSVRLRLRGALNRNALRSALNRIVTRHEILRTSFGSEDGAVIQRIAAPDLAFPLEEQTCRIDGSALLPFDLTRAPLIRGQLVQTKEFEHVLTIVPHAIVADTWSVGVLIQELAVLYTAFCVGEPDPLPPLDRQFAGFASMECGQMRGEKIRWRREYWARVLAQMPAKLALPSIHPRRVSAISPICRVQVTLPSELSAQIQALAHRKEIPLFDPLLCAWAAVLGRWAGQEDIVIGTPMENRSLPGVERLIGPFENLVALRLRFSGKTTVSQLLKEVKSVIRKARSHQDVSFDRILEDSEQSECSPLQVLMAVNAPPQEVILCRELKLPGLEVCDVTIERTNSRFELSLSVDEGPDGLCGVLEYATGLFERETIERLLEGWKMALWEMTNDVHQTIAELLVMSHAERRQVLMEFNETGTTYAKDRLIHELFEEQAARKPDALAVEHDGRQLTYGQLNRRANQLARYLVGQGVDPDHVVGICVERGLEMVVGVLAILKAGGAYLPLDPNYPGERLRQMLEDAAPQVVLSETELLGMLPASEAKVIAVDEELGQLAAFIDEDLRPAELGLSPEDLVYVIYTSGSTGRPKGTAMRHRSVVNLIEWHRRSFGDGQGRRTLQFAGLSFDVAFQEIFSTLCTGGTLVLLDEWVRRDPKALTELLTAGSIETLFVPPLMLQSIAEHCKSENQVPVSLKDVITAGEQLRVSGEIRELFGRLKGCRLHNHYGPTETHVVTALTLEGNPAEWPDLPPIGRPIANTQIYVLDGQMQPVPIGVTGEIFVGGANVACGYLNRPELTEQRFVVDPYSTNADARLYKTGDLGRWRADGVLEYLGRNDDQVKIRGFRVELGEIEAQLARHERVKEAAVVAREDVPGQRRLVAYVITRGAGPPSVNGLREYLKGALPEYMVPSAFVMLEKLPLTPSGKLDRRALPAPDLSAYVSREYEAPQGETEKILARIWQELLRIEQVGRNDNFFELGGHSLLIVQMVELLSQAGLAAEIRQVYENSTLAGLALTLSCQSRGRYEVPPNLIPPDCETITPQMLPLVQLESQHIERIVQSVPGGIRNIQDIYPLAPLQEGMLFDFLMSGSGNTYVLPSLLVFSSREGLDRFLDVLQRVMMRHDALRTAVLWEGLPRPVQVVYRHARLPVLSIAIDGNADPLDVFKTLMTSGQQEMNLNCAPLLRIYVAPHSMNGQWCAGLMIHNLICDNDSLQAMILEIKESLAEGIESLPVPTPYRSHVAHALAIGGATDSEIFFRQKLGSVDEPTAAFGILDMQRRGQGRRIAQYVQRLPEELFQSARTQARRWGVATATLLHAAWALLVSRTSGRDDVVFGTVLLGRMHDTQTARRALGMFINTLPIRLRLAGVSVRELITNAQREIAELVQHEHASLAVAQRCSAVVAPAPLFNTLFNYMHSSSAPGDTAVRLSPEMVSITTQEWTSYPITMSVYDTADALHLVSQSVDSLSPSRLAAYFETALESLLCALTSAPATPASELPVIPETERRLIVEDFNDTTSEFPRDKAVHRLFEAWVAQGPHRTAVTCEGHVLSYSELNGAANRLAHFLRDSGIERGECVPIIMTRSLQMLIAQLAVLKCGGAYVPLEPHLPPDRLNFIVHDCGAKRVIFTGDARCLSLPETVRTIDCVESAHVIDNMPAENLKEDDDGSHPAYVMYTSGSTGTPKGVIVPHRAINRLAINGGYADIRTTDCFAHCSNPAFDASTFELWGALLNGARLAIVPQPVLLDPEQFVPLLAAEGVTILFLTVGLLTEYADALAPLKGRLRYLLTGGDVVDPGVIKRAIDSCRPEYVVNAYGPTECTTFATTYIVHEPDLVAASLPIGRPISNTYIYVLDSHGRPVPIGVQGELYIGGPGIALGYLNRPELSAERFLPDRFGIASGGMVYRTGDLGCWRPDGNIEFLGRNDQQIKIRGFRIEPGEIESHLGRHPGVREAVVVAREDALGRKDLVAYFTFESEVIPKAEELRRYLQSTLPQYMVPAQFVALDRLPLTANGKVDRRALPTLAAATHDDLSNEQPEGDIEPLVAEIWRRILKVERIGRDDNFFDLGGHSLLATQMILRIRDELSADVSVQDIFECPILRFFAARIETYRREMLLKQFGSKGGEGANLLEQVASLPDSQVRAWLIELKMEQR